ncbi:MAG: hypothetical protein MZV70_48865 [Desulfobacterales bacterium]|nr:hypothetical protein [Desulfobacterales bacterium]
MWKIASSPKGVAAGFLAVSELTRKIFLDEYPVDPARVKVVHPGIDASPYAKLDRERCRREIRDRFGIVPDETLILFVSMNFAVKGLDHILRGLGSLRRRNPGGGFRLLVIGRGDEKAYGRLAREMGLGDAVVFAGASRAGRTAGVLPGGGSLRDALPFRHLRDGRSGGHGRRPARSDQRFRGGKGRCPGGGKRIRRRKSRRSGGRSRKDRDDAEWRCPGKDVPGGAENGAEKTPGIWPSPGF